MSQEVGRDLGVPVVSQKAGATWRGIKRELMPWGKKAQMTSMVTI